MSLIKGKPSKSMFMDALVIAGIKTAEERLLAPVIGNGTFVSGAVKGGIGFVLPAIAGNNKWANLAATAFIVDCAEDVVNAGLNAIGWGGPTESGAVI